MGQSLFCSHPRGSQRRARSPRDINVCFQLGEMSRHLGWLQLYVLVTRDPHMSWDLRQDALRERGAHCYSYQVARLNLPRASLFHVDQLSI